MEKERFTMDECLDWAARVGCAAGKRAREMAREIAGPDASDEVIEDMVRLPKIHVSFGPPPLRSFLEWRARMSKDFTNEADITA